MSLRRKKLPLYAVISILLLQAIPSWSTENDDAEWIPQPSTTILANRGVVHTVSAEPLGAGRLTFSLLGSWYHQKNDIFKAPPAESNIMSGVFAFSWGVNSFVDVFAALPAYLITRPDPLDNTIGIGSFSGGLLGSLPLPQNSPLRLGAKFSLIGGTASDQINDNAADGYNFYDTRTKFDFQGLIMESLVFGDESRGIKIHLNQGASRAIDDERTNFLLSAGVEGIVHPMIILGAEVNSRTDLSNFAMKTDPLWLTLSFQLRTPHYFSTIIGSDITLSRERSSVIAPNALEPFRLFGGVVLSFDALQRKRHEAAQKAKQDALEKAEAENNAQMAQRKADSLAHKAKEDSLALAREREIAKKRADSLARKAVEDSIALAETRKQLEEEKTKRTDAEKQLLSTGLLLLDAVYFESGKAKVSINSKPYLNIIGKMLTKYPKLQIEVAGHTDNTGRYKTNMELSFARASSVKNYLIQIAPELANRLSARGYGPDMPTDTNTTADGRRNNRRVELQVTNKEALKEYK